MRKVLGQERPQHGDSEPDEGAPSEESDSLHRSCPGPLRLLALPDASLDEGPDQGPRQERCTEAHERQEERLVGDEGDHRADDRESDRGGPALEMRHQRQCRQ
jgi:hypothetical protein